jgi:RNA polymerase sigma factor (sigma-70 family)
MAAGPSSDVCKCIHVLFQEGTSGVLTDGQLMDRFTARQDRSAFAALVERHGPMVLRVCRAILRNEHDAQDAFQATFLVLVRRAKSVDGSGSVGPWLYGVARRIAIRAKYDARRRIVVERHAGETGVRGDESWIPAAPEEWSEIYEELGRLPEKYRAPMVLCYLEGLTTEAAALQLGCPKGTILSRLARARERLRARLVRRGLALPAGFLALGFALKADAATMPVTLVRATVQTAIHFSSKIVTGGEISRAIAVLAERVMRDMLLIKLKAAGGGHS